MTKGMRGAIIEVMRASSDRSIAAGDPGVFSSICRYLGCRWMRPRSSCLRVMHGRGKSAGYGFHFSASAMFAVVVAPRTAATTFLVGNPSGMG